MVSVRFVLLTLFVSNVIGGKNPCSNEDSTRSCTTNLANQLQLLFIEGVPGKLKFTDTLYADEVSDEFPHFKYTLVNSTMKGMENCSPTRVKINPELFFEYYMECHNLHLDVVYEVSGVIGSFPALDDKGIINITIYESIIMFHGDLGGSDDDDGKLIFQMNNYEIASVDDRGVKMGVTSYIEGNDKKYKEVQKYITGHAQHVEYHISLRLMKKFMDQYVKNINDYLKLASINITL